MTQQATSQSPARTTDQTVREYLETLPHDRRRDEETRITTERKRDLLWHRKPTKDARGRDTDQTNQETLERAISRHAARQTRRAQKKVQA